MSASSENKHYDHLQHEARIETKVWVLELSLVTKLPYEIILNNFQNWDVFIEEL